MKLRYCLPIIKNQPSEVLEVIKRNLEDYHYFEVWLDYVDGLDKAFVERLVDLLGSRLVLLFRRQKLESIKMSLEQRHGWLELLDESPALVDLDIITQQDELEYIAKRHLAIKLIASYHNYQKTPSTVQLRSIIGTMDRYSPSIYKLACLCANRGDAVRLLGLLLELEDQGVPAIVLGMGKFGLATRVFGSLWSNQMVFAPLEAAEASAPGQLTKAQLAVIFKELQG